MVYRQPNFLDDFLQAGVGFDDVFFGPLFDRFKDVLRVTKIGQEDYFYVTTPGVITQSIHDFMSAHNRHIDVEQNHLWVVGEC